MITQAYCRLREAYTSGQYLSYAGVSGRWHAGSAIAVPGQSCLNPRIANLAGKRRYSADNRSLTRPVIPVDHGLMLGYFEPSHRPTPASGEIRVPWVIV